MVSQGQSQSQSQSGKKRKKTARRKNKYVKRFSPQTRFATSFSFNPLKTAILPAKLKVTLPYYVQRTLNVGSLGFPVGTALLANGMFDIEPGVGNPGEHQPRGFDELMTLYDHYCVIGSKITVYATASSAQSTEGALVSIVLKDNNALFNDPRDIMETRVNQTKVLGLRDSGYSCIEMEMKANTTEFLGRTSPLSDSQLKGSSSANPVETAYFQVYVHPATEGTDIGAVYCNILVEYTAILIEPRTPLLS